MCKTILFPPWQSSIAIFGCLGDTTPYAWLKLLEILDYLHAPDQSDVVIKGSQSRVILFIPFKEIAMRAMFTLARAFKNWFSTFSCQFQLGFITASEIAYADWPESARRPAR
jgi:hypothetical protein